MTAPTAPAPDPARAPRRPLCQQCLRPAAACICRWSTPLHSDVDLLILQHPMEVGNAKGSARLLHLSLAGSRLLVGESFDPALLTAQLHAGGRTPVLLYPDTPAGTALELPAPPAMPERPVPGATTLVVLDGTWRKSRKMLYLNPALQRLPRIALRDTGPSLYRIRKAQGADQLSTLEAACHALAQIDGDAARYQALLARFAAFNAAFALHQGHLNRA